MGFPSPYGDYGSYHVTIAEQSSQNQNGFRPLTGIMVLIAARPPHKGQGLKGVSVPLRGLWFLSREIKECKSF